MGFVKVKAIEFEGDWYVIPSNMESEFIQLINDFYYYAPQTEEWHKICGEIDLRFGNYATGGDLNLVELWADI